MKGMLNKKTLTLVSLLLFLSLLVGCFPLINQSPIIISTPITLAEVNELYTYEVKATDPNGDSLTYSLEVKPSGMTIISATGLIKWIPTAKGDYPVVVKVTDGTLDITQSFTIVVSEAEEPGWTPIITSTPITTATIGVLYTYDVNATDPNDDTLTYSLTTYPSGMTISSATGLIMWTPTAKGNYAVVVKVSDGVLDISQSFTITVSELPAVNQAPVIYSTQITTATVGVTYVYDVNATDPDEDILTYSLTTYPNGMAINPANGLIWWTPIAEGAYAVVMKVSDGVLFDTQSFIIVVDVLPSVNHFPIITSTPGSTATVGVEYVYDVKAVDPDGDTLTYTLITKPGGMTIDLSTIRWTPTGGQVGVGNFTVKVSDGQLSATQSFGIIVKAVEPEPEPELTEIEISPEAITLLKGDSQQLTVTAIYSDGSNANITSDCIYASSDSDIASVGVYGLIMAMGFGEATIHVSATPNGIVLTDAIEVTVVELAGSYSYSWTTSIMDSTDFDFIVGMGWSGPFPWPPNVYFFFHPDEIPLGGYSEPIGGAWLFENIDFGITSAGQAFSVTSVADDPDFAGFANLLTNGTDDGIWFGYMGDCDNIASAGGQKDVQESLMFSGTDVGTDFPGLVIQSVSLTFNQIYLDAANVNKLVLDFTIDIYVGLLNS